MPPTPAGYLALLPLAIFPFALAIREPQFNYLEVPSSVQVTFESLEAECGREGDPLKRLWWCRVNLRAPGMAHGRIWAAVLNGHDTFFTRTKRLGPTGYESGSSSVWVETCRMSVLFRCATAWRRQRRRAGCRGRGRGGRHRDRFHARCDGGRHSESVCGGAAVVRYRCYVRRGQMTDRLRRFSDGKPNLPP